MKFKLLEKFSSSMPDWLREYIQTYDKKSSSYESPKYHWNYFQTDENSIVFLRRHFMLHDAEFTIETNPPDLHQQKSDDKCYIYYLKNELDQAIYIQHKSIKWSYQYTTPILGKCDVRSAPNSEVVACCSVPNSTELKRNDIRTKRSNEKEGSLQRKRNRSQAQMQIYDKSGYKVIPAAEKYADKLLELKLSRHAEKLLELESKLKKLRHDIYISMEQWDLDDDMQMLIGGSISFKRIIRLFSTAVEHYTDSISQIDYIKDVKDKLDAADDQKVIKYDLELYHDAIKEWLGEIDDCDNCISKAYSFVNQYIPATASQDNTSDDDWSEYQ